MMKLDNKDRYKIGIYCIENMINNKKYIGHSKNIYQRISTHRANMTYGHNSGNRYLNNSVKKHGLDNFTYYVLEYLDTYDDCLIKKLELYYIQKYQATNPKYGYNCKEDNCDECNIVSSTTKQLHKQRLQERYTAFTKDDLNTLYLKIARASGKYSYLQCDINRNIIKEYSCRKEIELENPTFKLNPINQCCLGFKNTYKGYIWIYKNKSDGYIHYDKLKIPKYLHYKNRIDENTTV